MHDWFLTIQHNYLKYPELCTAVSCTLHKSYEFFHLHLQINNKSNLCALLFKPGEQFQLTDSVKIFFATCAFTINNKALNHKPWTRSKLHQLLSSICIWWQNVLQTRPEPKSCSWLDWVVSRSHRCLQKALLTCSWFFFEHTVSIFFFCSKTERISHIKHNHLVTNVWQLKYIAQK